jgi:hypothetical protein
MSCIRKFILVFVLTNLWFYFGKRNLRRSAMLCAFLSHGNLNLLPTILKLSANEKIKPFRCPTNLYRVMEVSPWRVKGVELQR